jgi:mono/diheme cytochrome c family protein
LKPQRRHTLLAAASLAAAGLLALQGCRGQTSEEPPLWIKHGMEFQPKGIAYERSRFTADGRVMQAPPAGTVAVGFLNEDADYWQGGKDSASLVKQNPLKLTPMVMERGQERFNIYCTPCHSQTGVGDGLVIKRGFTPPPNFHDDRLVNVPDGHIFQVISHGIRTMPAYGKQIPAEDRWAIVAYIRALQRSQRATINDVPDTERGNLR